MGSMTLGTRSFQPTPPEKGSFPLDHEGDCKSFFAKYMICLHKNDQKNTACRVEAKDYLNCRMENNLMAPEKWSKLGYADLEAKEKKDNPNKNL